MDFTRLFDIPEYQLHCYPRSDSFAERHANGEWISWATSKVITERDAISAGLHARGIRGGQRMGILAHCGSAHWLVTDMALQQIGVISVPIHATVRAEELAYIIKDAGLVGCFVSNEEMYMKWREATVDLPVYGFTRMAGLIAWDDLACVPDEHDLEKLRYQRDMVEPGHLATILYTSGTTGQPKGVMLSHDNIVSNIKAVLAIVPVDRTMTALSFLPLSHIFERMVSYVYQAAGTGVYFAPGIETLPKTLLEVRPHFFTAVPRILERSYDRLHEMRLESG